MQMILGQMIIETTVVDNVIQDRSPICRTSLSSYLNFENQVQELTKILDKAVNSTYKH